MDTLRYTQFLSSKICHDLITPVNAVQSGLEILMETGPSDDIMDLIQGSAHMALRRLVFFRAIFGAHSTHHLTSFDAIEKLLQDYAQPMGIQQTIKTSIHDPSAFDFATLARLILNLSYLIFDLTTQGGLYHLSVHQKEDASLALAVQLTGTIFEMRPDIRFVLSGEAHEDALSPQNIQAHMTYTLFKSMDLSLCIEESSRTAFRCLLSSKPYDTIERK